MYEISSSTTSDSTSHRMPVRPLLLVLLAAICVLTAPLRAVNVKIADITHLSGEATEQMVGLGLVLGLKGTGDGGSYFPAMRPLMNVLGALEDPVALQELNNASNVAIVALSAEIPAIGTRVGEKLDVKVSTFGAATSLRGGRLFLSRLVQFRERPDPTKPAVAFVMADAAGEVQLDDAQVPTRGIVRGGAVMRVDARAQVVNQNRIELILDDSNANRTNAAAIAKRINESELNGVRIAEAMDAKTVRVEIPESERIRPNDFISRILQLPVQIDPAEARVVVNRLSGTIVITGDVEISPTIIQHKGLTITTVQPEPVPTARNPQTTERRSLAVDPSNQGGPKLQQLLDALDAIKVPTEDRISILQGLARSGKLHAKVIIDD